MWARIVAVAPKGKVDDGYGDVFLVIDGWGVFRGDYDELETKVQQIVARGLTFGVHVLFSANRWMEIRANISDLIGTKLELRLGDPSDSQIDRHVADTVPKGALLPWPERQQTAYARSAAPHRWRA